MCKDLNLFVDTSPRDIFEGVRLPEVKKVIGADGAEKAIDDSCVREIWNHAFQIVADHKYTCVDFNDVANLLQSGESAVVTVVECNGPDRAERTALTLVERVESAGWRWEEVKGLLLHFQFADAASQPCGREYAAIEDLVGACREGFGMLCGFSDNGKRNGDSWTVTAIAVK